MRTRAGLHLAALLAFAILIRLPFLDQAFQLDDANYLTGAEYVQKDPAHPWLASYVFLGKRFNMTGHPHPPLNVWALGLIRAVLGEVREMPFHTAYMFWTLLAAAAAYSLARRFSARPAIAALLFLVTPAFVVHGNALEADVPFTALWLCSAAAFVRAVDTGSRRWLLGSAFAIALASLTAYQAVFLVPVLGAYVYLQACQRKRQVIADLAVLAVVLIPLAVIAGYQLYQRIETGALPASVLMGHFRDYGLQSVHNKVRNALALTAHLGWLVFPGLAVVAFGRLPKPLLVVVAAATAGAVFADPHPLFWVSFGAGLAAIGACAHKGDRFLRVWVLVFFGGALIIFFAGAARYLLPIALPLAILATNALRERPRWLIAGFAAQLVFSLALARSHYEQSNAVRDFVRDVKVDGRLWINGEWGLPYYGIERGGNPLLLGQTVGPGEWIISSQLGYPLPLNVGGGELRTVAERVVTPSVPLRLLALNSRSAFSTISFGIRPFDITTAPADILRVERVQARPVVLERILMSDAASTGQIVSGLYPVEAGQWRWASRRALVLLKRPEAESRVEARIYIPPDAPGRRIEVFMDGQSIGGQTLPGAGMYTVRSAPVPGGTGSASVEVVIDRTFSPPGDRRELGFIAHEIGFRRAAAGPL